MAAQAARRNERSRRSCAVPAGNRLLKRRTAATPDAETSASSAARACDSSSSRRTLRPHFAGEHDRDVAARKPNALSIVGSRLVGERLVEHVDATVELGEARDQCQHQRVMPSCRCAAPPARPRDLARRRRRPSKPMLEGVDRPAGEVRHQRGDEPGSICTAHERRAASATSMPTDARKLAVERILLGVALIAQTTCRRSATRLAQVQRAAGERQATARRRLAYRREHGMRRRG